MKQLVIAIIMFATVITLLFILPYDNRTELEKQFKEKSCSELLSTYEMDLETCENKLIDAEAEVEYLRLQLRLK